MTDGGGMTDAGLVYIGGTGHSGSTLLDLLLNNHSMIQSTGEIHRLNHYARGNLEPCTCGQPVAECPFWLDVERRVRESRGLAPETRPLLSDEIMIRTEAVGGWRSVVEKAALVQPSLPLGRALGRAVAPAHYRAARASLEWYRAIRKATGTSLVVDSSKDPRRLKWLYTVAPAHYRLVYLVRDGRAVTASGIRRRGHSMEEVARKWRALHRRSRAAQRSIPAGQKLRVRYETLCTEPERVLREIHRFLGVPGEDGGTTIRREGSHNIGGNAMRLRAGETTIRLDDRWKRELSPQQLEVFDRIAGRLNRRLGYE